MRCYRCERDSPVLFPILTYTTNRTCRVIVTAYICATCHKESQKQLREGEKK